MRDSKKNLKKESRIAICCNKKPYVIIVKRNKSVANVFIVDEPSELLKDRRFEEVMYMDKDCPEELGLYTIDSKDSRLKRMACLIAALVSTLSKGNDLH